MDSKAIVCPLLGSGIAWEWPACIRLRSTPYILMILAYGLLKITSLIFLNIPEARVSKEMGLDFSALFYVAAAKRLGESLTMLFPTDSVLFFIVSLNPIPGHLVGSFYDSLGPY